MIIVELIKELMYQQRLTIGYLSQVSGIAYETIDKVVTQNVVPTPEDAKVLLWALGVKLEDVLCLY